MEWMLQVADELDDVIGALRLCGVGLRAELGLLVAGSLGIGAVGAAVAAGAQVALIWSAAIALCIAAYMKVSAARIEA
jgi:hypothetical protein